MTLESTSGTVSEVYGASTGGPRLVNDFISAWQKVMELDRYDLHRNVANT